MAVNLSARQIAEDDFVDELRRVLQDTGLAPDLLELELTENVVMRDIERAARVLGAIKALGVRIAIDDFGVGHSSLAYLKRFPIDTLKLDRSFVRDVADSSESRAIAEVLIAQGKTLSMRVVGEGVETHEQQAFLRQRACDEMQGFYFSKPIASGEFSDLLRKHAPFARRGDSGGSRSGDCTHAQSD
jgi:EAL domain-containing protein (putative c-di-GMP-specific phosphodiesterase class I)